MPDEIYNSPEYYHLPLHEFSLQGEELFIYSKKLFRRVHAGRGLWTLAVVFNIHDRRDGEGYQCHQDAQPSTEEIPESHAQAIGERARHQQAERHHGGGTRADKR